MEKQTYHTIVYQYINLLVKRHPKTLYAQQWSCLTDPKSDGQPMFKWMNWTQMGICLDIKDFHQYCDFISKCPGIGECLKLIIHRGAFELTTLKLWKNIELIIGDDPQDKDLELASTMSTTDKVMTDQRECVETQENYQQLLQDIIPLFKHYIKTNQEDQYARLGQEWLDQDLNKTSTNEDVQNTCEITGLEDLYFLLKFSIETLGF